MKRHELRGLLSRPGAVVRRVKDALRAVEETRDRTRHLEERLGAFERRLDAGVHAAEVARDAANAVALRSLDTDPQRIRVAFLVHNADAWESIASIVRAMQADHRYETFVVSVPKRFPGESDFGGEEAVHAFLERRGVPHWRFAFEDSYRGLAILRGLSPDVLFRQSQWDADLQPGYSTDNLAFTRLCLVPYEIVNTTRNVGWQQGVADSATDSPFHRACWRVFTANGLSLQRAQRKGVTGARQYVHLGHPKVDAIRAAAPRWPFDHQEGRWRVVWSAHHSINTGWSDFGRFPMDWRGMLAWAESAPDVEFVFSPHPGLRSELASPHISAMRAEEVAEFWARWDALSNTASHLDGDYLGLLNGADMVVSDGISMLHEYQIAGKPVVWLEREGHAPFNKQGRIMARGIHPVADVAEARAWSERFQAGEPDPLADAQRDTVQALFSGTGAGAAIVEYIAAEIAAEVRVDEVSHR